MDSFAQKAASGPRGRQQIAAGEVRRAWTARLLVTLTVLFVLCVKVAQRSSADTLFALLATLAVYGLAILVLSRVMTSDEGRLRANLIGLILESLVLTAVLTVLGGLQGPLAGLYGILVLLGGLTLGRTGALAVGGTSLAGYSLALVLLHTQQLPQFALAAHAEAHSASLFGSLFLAAVLVASMLFATARFTELLRMRASKAESRYWALFNAAQEPLVVWDPQTLEILDANEGATALAGLPREDLVGGYGLELVPPEHHASLLRHVRELKLDGTATPLQYVRPDGDVRHLSLSHSSLDYEQRPANVTVVKDRTDQVRLGEEQQRYAERLEREVEARTGDLEDVNRKLRQLQSSLVQAQRLSAAEDLAASVAHSINNPLAALLGTVELALESSSASAPADPALERVLYLAHRIKRVVDSTLELFRRGTLKLEPTAPKEIVEALCDELRNRAAESKVLIELKVESNLPNIQVDRTLIVAALVSIAENAIEAMRTGGTLWVEAEAVPTVHAVRFRLTDTGPGVPASIRHRILDPFFTTKGGGTGLGLAIANGIIQGHQGTIRLDDRPLGGCVVTVELATEAASLAG